MRWQRRHCLGTGMIFTCEKNFPEYLPSSFKPRLIYCIGRRTNKCSSGFRISEQTAFTSKTLVRGGGESLGPPTQHLVFKVYHSVKDDIPSRRRRDESDREVHHMPVGPVGVYHDLQLVYLPESPLSPPLRHSAHGGPLSERFGPAESPKLEFSGIVLSEEFVFVKDSLRGCGSV